MGYSFHGASSHSITENSLSVKEGNVLLTTHSTHFIYSYMASDIW